VPHHWTKISEARLADQRDKVFEDTDTGAVYVLGNAHRNATKEEIASWYGVPPENVTFPLTEK
jgi:hypothetical protein